MRKTSTIRTFLLSRPGDQARITLAAVLLVSISLWFSIGSFSQIRKYLLWFCDVSSSIVLGAPTPERIVSAVDVADRHVPGDRTCLMRSLTAEALLRLYAFTPDHRIGVTKEKETDMKAHSWLEIDDNVLIGNLEDLSRYEPLPSLQMWDQL